MSIVRPKTMQLPCTLLFATALWTLPAEADDRGMPNIIDGDSLEIEGKRFDLFGIDSPEPGTHCQKENGKNFDCGRIATTALLDLTAGLDVTCIPVTEGDQDRSTPTPAHCTAGGFSLNRNMVHTGWAVADRAASNDYVETEGEAKAAKRGLWRWKIPSPPWPDQ